MLNPETQIRVISLPYHLSRLRVFMSYWLRTYGTFAGFILLIIVFATLRQMHLQPQQSAQHHRTGGDLAIAATVMTIVMVVGD